MQYEITLPADYDMEIIRNRVRTRGSALDNYPGLLLKAYGIRQRGVAGSTVNQYAPFYVWNDTTAMGRFLWGGGGFSGIVESFGRPAVRQWTAVTFATGRAYANTPLVGVRSVSTISPEADLISLAESVARDTTQLCSTDGVHSSVVAIDPQHWTMVRYTLWADEPGPQSGCHYRILHLSKPAA